MKISPNDGQVDLKLYSWPIGLFVIQKQHIVQHTGVPTLNAAGLQRHSSYFSLPIFIFHSAILGLRCISRSSGV